VSSHIGFSLGRPTVTHQISTLLSGPLMYRILLSVALMDHLCRCQFATFLSVALMDHLCRFRFATFLSVTLIFY
jgi:hypothetical protein